MAQRHNNGGGDLYEEVPEETTDMDSLHDEELYQEALSRASHAPMTHHAASLPAPRRAPSQLRSAAITVGLYKLNPVYP
jgi:hypothetical protein